VATVRPEVVEGIVKAYVRRDEPALAEALREANDVERRYVADLLADDAIAHLRATGYLRDDSLLGMRRDQLAHLARQGHALLWLLDRLPNWAAHPERTLADVLKIEPRDRVEWLARELRIVGLTDLDELLGPELRWDPP
jgi:hypothetical protein